MAVAALALLFALGAFPSYALSAVVLALAVLALPQEGIPFRIAGGIALVVLAAAWPERDSVLTAGPVEAARNVSFARALVGGALLGEAGYVAWRAFTDQRRSGPLG